MEVDPYGLVGMIVFYIAILSIGLYAAYRSRITQDQSQDHLITAGRNIGVFVGMFTMTATWVGGGYINGTAEATYKSSLGILWAQAPTGYCLSLIFGGIFFAKQARSRRYVTMLDPFQNKYGPRIGGLLYLPALFGEMFWSAATLSALGGALNIILKLNITISIIISTVFAVMYTLFGGQLAVAFTDVAQLIFMMFGLILCIPFAWYNENVDMTRSLSVSDWAGTIPLDKVGLYIDNYLLLIGGGIPWQVYFQRILSSNSPETAQKLSFLGAVGCFLACIPPMIIGIIAKNAAAVMSSVDASVLSVASMFTHNIYKGIFKPNVSGQEMKWVLRSAIIGAGILASTLAIVVKSIYGLWYLCGDIVYVVLLPQLILVMYYEPTNGYGVLNGLLVSIVLRLLIGDSNMNLQSVINYNQNIPIKTLIMLTNLLITILVSKLTNVIFKYRSLARFDVLNIVSRDIDKTPQPITLHRF